MDSKSINGKVNVIKWSLGAIFSSSDDMVSSAMLKWIQCKRPSQKDLLYKSVVMLFNDRVLYLCTNAAIYLSFYLSIKGGTVHRCHGSVRTSVQGSRFCTILVKKNKKNILGFFSFILYSITAGALGGKLPVFVIRLHTPNRDVRPVTVRYEYIYRSTPNIYLSIWYHLIISYVWKVRGQYSFFY